jgi:nucleoside-diphosphate-sugar epimerase
VYDIIAKIVGYQENLNWLRFRPGEVHTIYITGERLKTILGWQPEVNLRDGLKQTVEFIKNNVS